MPLTTAKTILIYLVALLIFLAVDMVWLGVAAAGFYKRHLGYLFGPKVNWTAAGIFYILFVVGILIFAVKPALEQGSLGRALMWGALFGFFTYATYDLTNLATIRDWPLIVTVVDLVWGTILCCIVSGLTYLVSSRWIA